MFTAKAGNQYISMTLSYLLRYTSQAAYVNVVYLCLYVIFMQNNRWSSSPRRWCDSNRSSADVDQGNVCIF